MNTTTPKDTTMPESTQPVAGPFEPSVRPCAYLHKVRVCNGDPGETDEALSFAADSFPLGDAGLFESIAALPLYRVAPLTEGALMGVYMDFDRRADKTWSPAEYLLRFAAAVQAAVFVDVRS